ncbi:hypothetical protein WN48_01936 [Eufriesea mexicana]|uniref:Uncharacterized protein n=1 Tax=Eufriesea mexicana TaxID=516756 RepID=A0A310S4T8_9HYME|nr:hypothetical protein WN48_01936 [Eufriesea mexicana]
MRADTREARLTRLKKITLASVAERNRSSGGALPYLHTQDLQFNPGLIKKSYEYVHFWLLVTSCEYEATMVGIQEEQLTPLWLHIEKSISRKTALGGEYDGERRAEGDKSRGRELGGLVVGGGDRASGTRNGRQGQCYAYNKRCKRKGRHGLLSGRGKPVDGKSRERGSQQVRDRVPERKGTQLNLSASWRGPPPIMRDSILLRSCLLLLLVTGTVLVDASVEVQCVISSFTKVGSSETTSPPGLIKEYYGIETSRNLWILQEYVKTDSSGTLIHQCESQKEQREFRRIVRPSYADATMLLGSGLLWGPVVPRLCHTKIIGQMPRKNRGPRKTAGGDNRNDPSQSYRWKTKESRLDVRTA